MEPFNSLSPCELLVLAVVIAIAICDDLDANTQNVLGNLITAIGALILTWAAQQELLAKFNTNAKQMTIQDIQAQISILQEQCSQLENKK